MKLGPGIPVLMYHALVAHPTPGINSLHVDVKLFAQHMAWLHAAGYVAITVPELLRQLAAPPSDGTKAVVITFDDGYWSLARWAAPILRQYGYPATLFLTTGFVGQPVFDAALAGTAPPADRPLTWAEVQQLQAAGWDIQAHSCTHRPHAALPAAQLRGELIYSRQAIVKQLNKSVKFYAFPYGNYSRRVLAAVKEAGYQAGFSVHDGLTHAGSDLRRLPRLEINSSCTLAVFEKLVHNGYASVAKSYWSRLRDALFTSPLIKDALQRVLAGFIN